MSFNPIYIYQDGPNKPMEFTPAGVAFVTKTLSGECRAPDILAILGVAQDTFRRLRQRHGITQPMPRTRLPAAPKPHKPPTPEEVAKKKEALRLYGVAYRAAKALREQMVSNAQKAAKEAAFRRLIDNMAIEDSFAEKSVKALRHFGKDIWVQKTGEMPHQITTYWLNGRVTTIPQLIRSGAKILQQNGVDIKGWPTEFLP